MKKIKNKRKRKRSKIVMSHQKRRTALYSLLPMACMANTMRQQYRFIRTEINNWTLSFRAFLVSISADTKPYSFVHDARSLTSINHRRSRFGHQLNHHYMCPQCCHCHRLSMAYAIGHRSQLKDTRTSEWSGVELSSPVAGVKCLLLRWSKACNRAEVSIQARHWYACPWFIPLFFFLL